MRQAGCRASANPPRPRSAAPWRDQGSALPGRKARRKRPLPSAQESRRSRRGMARAAAPDHRAQKRAGRRRRPRRHGNRGGRDPRLPRIESGRIGKSRAAPGRHRRARPPRARPRRVRGQARLERRAANGGRRARRRGGGRLHPAGRRAAARAAAAGIRRRGERPGREQWTPAASRQREPRQAQGQRDAHQPAPVLPQSGKKLHLAAIHRPDRARCKRRRAEVIPVLASADPVMNPPARPCPVPLTASLHPLLPR